MTTELHRSPQDCDRGAARAHDGWERLLAAGPLAVVLTSSRPGFSISGIELRARVTRDVCVAVRMDVKLSWLHALAPRRR